MQLFKLIQTGLELESRQIKFCVTKKKIREETFEKTNNRIRN